MMEEFLRDRDEMIFGSYDEDMYFGGIRNFHGISLETLTKLISCDYINLNETMNNSPTIREFYGFMSRYPGKFEAHGFVNDTDVVITGIETINTEASEINMVIANDFWITFNKADRLMLDCHDGGCYNLFCWYD